MVAGAAAPASTDSPPRGEDEDAYGPMDSHFEPAAEDPRNASARADGEPHAAQAFVFGNEVGEPVKDAKRAWERAVLVAHGHKSEYVKRDRGEGKKPVATASLTAESRQRLREIDLHLHDLR